MTTGRNAAMETDAMTTPAQYRERWPHSVTATGIAAGVTELYQSRLRETTSLHYRRVGFAESLLLAVLRESHQGEPLPGTPDI